MNSSEINLPSNRKFGFFFTCVFGLVATYFYVTGSISWAYLIATMSALFFIATIVKDKILLPLNKLWMRFGLLLGMIISPIILGIIFFGILTPIAFIIRLSGRDELRLNINTKLSHWISREEPIYSESFKNQF